jgi:hypothetical protein
MSSRIKNIDDLHSEIAKLNSLHLSQKEALAVRFKSPSDIYATVLSLFPNSSVIAGLRGQDFVGLLSRIVLPVALNKTLFRHSNFIVKALVGMASQKASHFISEDSVTGLWDKAKGLFNKLTHKDAHKRPKTKNLQGYGIASV